MYLVHVSFSNSKLGASIPCINMPQGITCPKDAPCRKGCYATRGNFGFDAVKNSHLNNLRAYRENPKLFFDMIAEATSLCLFVRWHSSGDIVDTAYLEGMCRVARKNKNTVYLCFTKQFKIVNDYVAEGHKIPKNLQIVFSSWMNYVGDNPYNFPTSWVYFPKGEKEINKLIPQNSFRCPGKCEKCQNCWKMKKGDSVVFKKH